MRAISGSAGLVVFVLLFAGSAHASVQISSAATKNMNCSAGVCSPTAKDAELNVNDLTNMLSSADVTVKSGKRAVTIGILSPLAWASTHRLTLDADLNVNIKAQVTVEGTAGLTIITNDGGSGGDLMIYPGGKIQFWDTSSSLIINGESYVLVADLNTLANDIATNPEDYYAFVRDQRLKHQTYRKPPITDFFGTFEGLGNSISNLEVKKPHRGCGGMFARAGAYDKSATIRDFNLKNANISNLKSFLNLGVLVGCSYAVVINVSTEGSVSGGYGATLGGLVGTSHSTISRSHSTAAVGPGNWVGGLVGMAFGDIDQSYATGAVKGNQVGGLAGNASRITNSYATGGITVGQYNGGGLTGAMQTSLASYSIGKIEGGSGASVGGFVGYDDDGAGYEAAYWDLDTSGINDPSRGCGNYQNCSGVAGLTDAQLKSGLPAGFDPNIWAQSPGINNGYPYLIANPPP